MVKPGHAEKPSGPETLAYKGSDTKMRTLVRDSGVFEHIVPQLDKALRLPRDIPIALEQCDTVNAFYDPAKVSITMCDEMVVFYGELFDGYAPDEAKETIVGALVSVFLHQKGHALIDSCSCPPSAARRTPTISWRR